MHLANPSQCLILAACLAFLTQIVAATGSLNGLPVLNGPINPVGTVYGMKKRVGDFIHPGLWHTHDDLERIRLGVLNRQDPWKTAFVNFSTDSFSQASVSDYLHMLSECY